MSQVEVAGDSLFCGVFKITSCDLLAKIQNFGPASGQKSCKKIITTHEWWGVSNKSWISIQSKFQSITELPDLILESQKFGCFWRLNSFSEPNINHNCNSLSWLDSELPGWNTRVIKYKNVAFCSWIWYHWLKVHSGSQLFKIVPIEFAVNRMINYRRKIEKLAIFTKRSSFFTWEPCCKMKFFKLALIFMANYLFAFHNYKSLKKLM